VGGTSPRNQRLTRGAERLVGGAFPEGGGL